MLSSQNLCNKQHEYFRYLNKSIGEYLFASNSFHLEMCKKGMQDGSLITFGQKPFTFHSISVREMIAEYGTVDENISRFSAEELRNSGLALQLGVERKYKNSLIYSYILNSCLCYVERVRRNGSKDCFYATKNMSVYAGLEIQEETKIDRLQKQFTTTYAEISSGIFEVVGLTPDRDGVQLSKQRLNINSKDTVIIPVYSIAFYIDYLLCILGKHQVMVTFIENGVEQKLFTSLSHEALAKWMHTNDDKEIEKVQDSWNNPFVFGELILPDLFRSNEFVAVRVLGITSIQKLD
ncbi:MAG TPA: hypothetical protein VNM45_13000 [Bacillus sp. (in: firmicutes)]|nr:hypothetical protein [Bacillus sp. (in: firmicutes)]